MVDLLYKIKWGDSGVLRPGTHSTKPDATHPWRCISEIIPGLYLTCEQEVSERQVAIERGIALILNMRAYNQMTPYEVYEFNAEQSDFFNREVKDFEQFLYELGEYTSNASNQNLMKRKVFIHNIRALDIPEYQIEKHFPVTTSLIRLVLCNRASLEESEHCWSYDQLHAVAVYCMLGISRSASIVAAYLVKSVGITTDVALSFMQMVRPVVNPNVGFHRQLLLWEAMRGQRIFDKFSARLVASQINDDVELLDYVHHHLPFMLKNSRLSQERRYLGLLISLIQTSSKTLADIYWVFESRVNAAIASEDYTDTPNFFVYVSEIIDSFQIYCEDIFANPCVFGTEIVYNDSFYFKVLKNIAYTGHRSELCDTVRAFCSILHEIDAKHSRFKGHLSVIFPKELSGAEVPQGMITSFPFLVFIAPYAEGFIQPETLVSLESEVCCKINGGSYQKPEKLVNGVKNKFLDAFLLLFSSKNTDSSTNSFPEGEWGFNFPFEYLKNDLEVQVFETLRTNESLPFNILTSNLKKISWELGQALILKFVCGLLAFRLILETVEQFLLRIYDNWPPNVVNLGEHKLPLTLIGRFIESMEAMYKQHFLRPCNIILILKSELEPLFEVGVHQTGGLWSLLK